MSHQPCHIFLVMALVLAFYPPDICSGGKPKIKIAPVKHLFGVGIGYQRVVQYKPVLVISKHSRAKKRPGWGWKPKKGWSPVRLEHHVHRHRQGGWRTHYQPRRKPMQHHPRGGYHQETFTRGWGWAESRPQHHKAGYRRGHQEFPQQSLPHYHQVLPPHGAFQDDHMRHNPPIYHVDGDNFQHASTGPPKRWPGGATETGDYPYSKGHRFPYATMGDYEDDSSAYETEVSEQWNNTDNLASTTAPPPPSIFPLSEPPHDDQSLSGMRKDFLKNHLKNYQQFQNYQESTKNHENHNWNTPTDNQADVHYGNPFELKPPGPTFTTLTDTHDTDPRGDQGTNFDYTASAEERHADHIEPSYENDDQYWNDLSRKLKVPASHQAQVDTTTTASPTPKPSRKVISARFRKITTAQPKRDKTFKPSPRMEEVGSPNRFYPSFQRLRTHK